MSDEANDPKPQSTGSPLSLKKPADAPAAPPLDEAAIQWSAEGKTYKLGTYEGIRILRLDGDVSSEMGAVSRLLDPAAEDGGKAKLVVNVGTGFLSSQVIGALVASTNKHTTAAGTMILCNLSEQTRTILALCKLEPLFKILPDEAAAVHKLQAG